MNRCITCRFYDLGHCRRSPPATRIFPDLEVFDHRVVSCWPEVTEDDWCGEHRQLAFPKPKEPTKPKKPKPKHMGDENWSAANRKADSDGSARP